MARFSMTEMRVKLKNQREMRSEKEKQLELLSRCLVLIRINNQKLSDLSIEIKKLEFLRSFIRDVNRRKLEIQLQLRALQLKDLKSKKHLYESEDEVLVIDLNDKAIESLKSSIKCMKNELTILRERERVLARDVELLHQSVHVVVEVPDQVLQRHQSEIEKLEKEIRESLQDETEDGFNQLIISTEEKIRNLFELKNNLLDIVFMKKSIRKMRSGGWY